MDQYASGPARGGGAHRRSFHAARRTALWFAALATTGALVSGCAQFDTADSAPFHPVPETYSGAQVDPDVPGPQDRTPPDTPPPDQSEPAPAPNGPCVDPDPAVIATCLDSTGAMVMLPDGQTALVAERTTGRIMRVPSEGDATEFAAVPVDAAGDGGLTGLALSPTFAEDQLVYAYVTTPSDNRVVRIAPGDAPKPILTGIPRGDTGNGGDLIFTAPDQLTVLTGDNGNSGAAADPGKLAGKLLRIRNPAPDSHDPTVVASGLGRAGGLCLDPKSGSLWITDRAPTMDRLQRLSPGGSTPTLVWSWTDRPGVGGCSAAGGTVVTALDGGKSVAALTVSPDSGAATGDPVLLGTDKYGHYGATALDANGAIWASTVNKTSGGAVATDDRVVIIPFSGGGSRV
ncbi:MAG: PQQ-dependent sugar dehydrogenase [Tomitella sp.]|nr:PQQ-dependent sugar dehydrogenase [Tomitella sp.]